MLTVRRSVLLLVVSSLAAWGVVAGTAAAAVECEDIANCTSVPNTPWVAVAPKQEPDDYGATWTVNCPAGSQAVGSDWNAAGNQNNLSVYVQQGSGVLVYGLLPSEYFLAVNHTPRKVSFQPLVGCQPINAASAGAAGFGGVVRRVVSHRLRPSRIATFTHSCRAGERLVHSGSGVGFFQRRPPSRRELRDVTVSREQGRRLIAVRVKTGPRVGDDERVRLQIHATCRR
jgi:hypothetical protein